MWLVLLRLPPHCFQFQLLLLPPFAGRPRGADERGRTPDRQVRFTIAEMADAAAYVESLGLDADMVEDVQEEIDNAQRAWAKVSGGGAAAGDAAFYSALMGELGSAFDEAVSGELLALEKGSLQAFTDWYVKWLFHEEELEDDDGGEGEEETTSGATKEANWSQVKWSVQPVAKPVEGVSWQCSTCRIINQWKDAKCLGCDDAAPHAADLPEVAPSSSSSKPAFAFSAPAPPASGGAISSSGFTFGGGSAAASGASIGSSGFTFPAAAAASTVPSTAPVVGGGFTFTPAASAVAPAVAETVFGKEV